MALNESIHHGIIEKNIKTESHISKVRATKSSGLWEVEIAADSAHMTYHQQNFIDRFTRLSFFNCLFQAQN